MTETPDDLIETCLVCLVAWDIAHDPPQCDDLTHPHALNRVGDWTRSGHGVAL